MNFSKFYLLLEVEQVWHRYLDRFGYDVEFLLGICLCEFQLRVVTVQQNT